MTDTRWHFASCAPGFESLLADDVRAAGGEQIREDPGGVAWRGPIRSGYAVCLWSRVATRVFEELQRGRIGHVDDLHAVASRVPWERLIRLDQGFSVRATVSGPVARDSRYAALKVKDAIADRTRAQLGARPDVDTDDPALTVRVTVRGRVATISRDLAGDSLHKRGYRPAQHRSPLNEALAAGLLLRSDWDRRAPVVDPMCGSATLLIEAALILADRAPGLHRPMAFTAWVDHDASAWADLLRDATRRAAVGLAALPTLHGNDLHPGALALARRAAEAAGVQHALRLHHGDVADYSPPSRPGFVVCNPPWGERLGDAGPSWSALGRWLRDQAPGATAWVLSGDPTLTRHLGMRASRKIPLRNGPIDCRWLRYDVRGPAVDRQSVDA